MMRVKTGLLILTDLPKGIRYCRYPYITHFSSLIVFLVTPDTLFDRPKSWSILNSLCTWALPRTSGIFSGLWIFFFQLQGYSAQPRLGVDGGSPCQIPIIRNGYVALSNLRRPHVPLSI